MRRLVLLTLLAVATSGCSDISPAVPGDSSAPAEATTNIADAFVDTQTTDQSPTPGPDVIDQDETASTPVNDVLEDAGSDAVGQADSVVPPQGDDGSEIINEDVTEPTDVVVDTSAPPADVAIDSNSDTLPGDGHTADTVIVDATIEDSMMPDSSSENDVPQDITLMDVMPPSDTSIVDDALPTDLGANDTTESDALASTDVGPVGIEGNCGSAAGVLTSAGCLFAPIVGNPSSLTYQGPLPWAVIAANPNLAPTVVELSDPEGNLIESTEIPGYGLHVFELDGPTNAQWEHPKASGIFDLVFRLESDAPIVAYQFQPYSSSFSATADATLLLPVASWGNNYKTLNAKGSGNSWVTIVGMEGPISLRIQMPQEMTGSTQAGGGVPAMSAGEVHLLNLEAQQSLRIYASPSVDLSGMGIYSGDVPVAVLVGSPGTSLPGPGFISFNDYLEEQLPPRRAWGKEVSAVKFRPRSNEQDLYRIIADGSDTEVVVSGDYNNSWTLNEGEFIEFLSDGSFHISANRPVLVAHGMVSSGNCDGQKDPEMWPGPFVSPTCGASTQASDMGDPALSFLTPIEQYRNNYVFLTPYTYAWDVLTVIAPLWAWSEIDLDGLPLPPATMLPGNPEYGYQTLLVEDGAHVLNSPYAGVGIEVYGYDCRLSYAYAGGLSLATINEVPDP